MEIVFCPRNVKEEIPVFKLKESAEESLKFIEECISVSNNNQGLVYVVFVKFKDEVTNHKDVDQKTILVSSDEMDISNFIYDMLDCENWNDLMLWCFEFVSYKEAFEYCLDLQEGY